VINQAHFDAVLDSLARSAGDPAWKAWAWHAAKEFEQINPYDLQGMQEALKQRMTAEKAPQ
jgi:hypothetical protein